MWREVVAVKRTFKDAQSIMKTELNRMRNEINGANREANSACNSVLLHLKQAYRTDEQQKLNTEHENNELKAQIALLKQQYDNAKHEINQRDIRLQELMQQIKNLEERCNQAENQVIQVNRLNDENERLNNALRDIAHAVVQDSETGISGGGSDNEDHLHLSQSGIIPSTKSTRRGRISQAFAESTISAVQAALHKYQLAIHDLQVKLQSSNDTLQNTKKQFENCEHTREILTSKVAQLTEKLDGSNSQLSELLKERDTLQNTIESLRKEKQNLEKGRSELNMIVSSF